MDKNTGSAQTPTAVVNAVYAKTILLGDSQTGRSELINNLDFHKIIQEDAIDHGRGMPSNRKFNIVIDESNFFSTIELTPAEIEHPSMTAYLKVWEYTQHLSKKDEELAFRGALFCIITFDICKVQSYRSVFDKWIPLKEQLSPDSFLYIVGTNADRHSYRQVELEEACKASAKKDAVYVEVSNANGSNFQLLRRLLCRRVHYMLQQKDIFASPAFQAKLKGSQFNDEHDSLSKSTKAKAFHSNAAVNDISIPALEPNIMSNSVGSILSSCFDLEDWEGYEKQEQEMLMIADKIDVFVENLANTADTNIGDLHSLTMNDSFLYHDMNTLPPLDRNLDTTNNQDAAQNEEQQHAKSLAQSFQQLKEAFHILGLSMPESLLQSQPKEDPTADKNFKSDKDHDPFALPNTARPNLRKMLVKLPGGHSAEMVLDLDANLEQQIELFLMSNGLHYDLEARRKLLQSTTKVQRDYLESRRNNVNNNHNNTNNGNNAPSMIPTTAGGAFAPPPYGNRSAPSSRQSTTNNTVSSVAGNNNASNILNTSR